MSGNRRMNGRLEDLTILTEGQKQSNRRLEFMSWGEKFYLRIF